MTTTTTGDRLIDEVLAMLADCHTKTTIAPDMPDAGEPAPPIDAPGYRVFVDDNFHYMDEDERYELGVFGTVDEAIAACKQIVDRCLKSMLKADTTAAALYEQYVNFGEDPYVKPVDPAAARVTFSAWDYAKAQCQVLASPRPTSI